MRIDIISVLPELMESTFAHSIIKRAIDKNLVEIKLHNLRDYSEDKHRRVDDYAFSGEAGMVIRIEPVYKIIRILQSERAYDEIIYTSPDGTLLNQQETILECFCFLFSKAYSLFLFSSLSVRIFWVVKHCSTDTIAFVSSL